MDLIVQRQQRQRERGTEAPAGVPVHVLEEPQAVAPVGIGLKPRIVPEDRAPTALYTYQEAVQAGYLVDFSLYQAKTRFQLGVVIPSLHFETTAGS